MEMRWKKTRRVSFSLLPLLLVFFLAPGAWGEEIGALLDQRMGEIRNNKPISIDAKRIMAADAGQLQNELLPFEKDTSPQVRHEAYALGWKVAMASRSPKIRQDQVVRLIKATRDRDPLVWQQSSKWLLQFQGSDFSSRAKTLLHEDLIQDAPRRETVLLAGVAGLREKMELLRSLLIDESQYETEEYTGRWYGTVGWAARLALARMGSEADVRQAIAMVESEPDEVIRVTRLLQDLHYVRQPQTVAVLGRYLESDERLPRQRPDVPGTRYCQYGLDLLAQILEGFPVKSVGPGGYSQAEIDQCRMWMRSQTSWKIIR